MYNGTGGNIAGTHGGKLPGEARQGHGRELVQHKVDVAGQLLVVDLVGAVVEGLERLGVEETHQEVKCVIIIRYHSVQCAFLFSQGIKVHIVMVGDGLDLRQIEGRQPDSGGHKYTF